MSLMLFTHYLVGYVGTAICSIGLVLALCSVYIFTRRQMRSAVSTYLTGLSISDSCLLLLGLVFAINSSIPPQQQSESFYSSRLHKLLFPYIYACIIWFQFTSVWVTIGFAVDRWFAIKWPMLHYTYSSKRACYIVVTIYGLGFIYALPRFFEYRTVVEQEKFTVVSQTDNYTEHVDYLVIINKFHNSSLYQYSVHLVLYSLFQSILPLLMLSYFNVELIRSVNASSTFLQHCTSTYGQSTRLGGETNTIRYRDSIITRSVICLIALFILCQVPASILNYIYMYHRNHPLLYICYDISNFLILLNSAVNFFIFTCFNRKFRRELARVCFHSKARTSLFLRTSSHPSLKRTSSHIRAPVTNQFDQIYLSSKHFQSNYWEYQERTGGNYRTGQRSVNEMRKKSSDSEYHLQSIFQQSNGLTNHPNAYDYNCRSLCELAHKGTTRLHPKVSKTSRPAVVVNPKKFSSASNTSSTSYYSRGQHLHYITCRRESNQQRPSGTAIHLSRSTMKTGSESSIAIDQKHLTKILADRSTNLNR